jgi:hypothetical protein
MHREGGSTLLILQELRSFALLFSGAGVGLGFGGLVSQEPLPSLWQRFSGLGVQLSVAAGLPRVLMTFARLYLRAALPRMVRHFGIQQGISNLSDHQQHYPIH